MKTGKSAATVHRKGLTPKLTWLPDETLFSLCSRVHCLSGHATASQTSLALLGHARAATHDFPGFVDRCLDVLELKRTERPQEVLFERTLLGFYRPFLTPVLADSAVARLRTSSMGSLKFQLGILTSRFGAAHPLKACPACVRDDRATFQTAYWHQAHQWPGVWWCHHHGEPLNFCTQRLSAGQRFAWVLPRESSLKNAMAARPDTDLFEALGESIGRLALLVQCVATLPKHEYLDAAQINRCLLARLEVLDLRSPGGRLDRGGIGDKLAAQFAPWASFPELSRFAQAPAILATQIATMLLRPGRKSHPLRQIALIHALFDDWTSFRKAYSRQMDFSAAPMSRAKSSHPTDPAADTRSDARVVQFLEAVRSGHSVSAAALAAAVDVGTGMAWAARAGIQTPRRPKRLKGNTRNPLLKQLRRGLDKSIAASRAGVSVQTITRLLQTEVGLRQAWNEAREEARRAEARLRWSRSLMKHESEGFQQVRQHACAAYSWLNRHDRAWLTEHLPSALRRVTSRKSAVDWAHRDRQLASQIGKLEPRGTGAPLRLWEIYLQVPELKAKLNQLNALPLTRAAVEALIGKPWTRGQRV